MAGRKSTKPAAAEVSEAETIESRTEDIKADTAGSKVEETKKAEPKKTAGKRAGAKTESVKTETAKAPAKKSAVRTASKKAEKANNLYVQYAGKSYSQEELMKIAKDVWKYDLKRKAGDLTSISLYVKPEENKVYYVMNEECTGSFDI